MRWEIPQSRIRRTNAKLTFMPGFALAGDRLKWRSAKLHTFGQAHEIRLYVFRNTKFWYSVPKWFINSNLCLNRKSVKCWLPTAITFPRDSIIYFTPKILLRFFSYVLAVLLNSYLKLQHNSYYKTNTFRLATIFCRVVSWTLWTFILLKFSGVMKYMTKMWEGDKILPSFTCESKTLPLPSSPLWLENVCLTLLL